MADESEALRARVADLETALSHIIDAIASVPPLADRVASLVQIPRVRARGAHDLQCSFCGKSQKEVKVLFAGAVCYICDECIGTCGRMLCERGEEGRRDD